jgi:phosphoglucosamine mutase
MKKKKQISFCVYFLLASLLTIQIQAHTSSSTAHSIKTNIFGTGGVRAKMGTDIFTLPALIQFGKAIAQWAQTKFNHPPHILLGSDTRQSCSLVKSALQSGLLLHGCVIDDALVAPTPTISQIVNYGSTYDLGIIISASHNPYYDNGIKIMYAPEGKISLDDELEITRLFNENILAAQSYETLGAATFWPNAHETYIKNLSIFFDPNFLKGITVVLDCAQGAPYLLAPEVFKHFGAQVIAINNQPNGSNINEHCGALHLNSLQEAVIAHNADIGFAFDGDGDRAIAVNRDGIIKDGDDILALLLDHPAYANEIGIVGTIMTNQGLAAYIDKKNKKLLRTNVGEKYITQKQDEMHMLLGGEPNGHAMLRDYMPSGDGIFAALRVMQVVLTTNNWRLQTFTKFPQVLINLPIVHKKDLSSEHFHSIIAEHEKQLHDGRIVIRYSGTEPLLRILVEDPESETAYSVAQNLAQIFSQELAH